MPRKSTADEAKLRRESLATGASNEVMPRKRIFWRMVLTGREEPWAVALNTRYRCASAAPIRGIPWLQSLVACRGLRRSSIGVDAFRVIMRLLGPGAAISGAWPWELSSSKFDPERVSTGHRPVVAQARMDSSPIRNPPKNTLSVKFHITCRVFSWRPASSGFDTCAKFRTAGRFPPPTRSPGRGMPP